MRKVFQSTRLQSTMALILAAGSLQAFPAWASAAAIQPSAVQVTIGSSSLDTNTSFTIPVSVKPTGKIASYNMQIDFDPSAFTITSIVPKYGNAELSSCGNTEDGCFTSQFNNDEGWIRAIWIDATTGSEPEHPITSDQVLFEIKGTTKQLVGSKQFSIDATSPENITFTDGHFQGSEPNHFALEVKSGTFSISDPPSASGPIALTTDIPVYVDGKLQEKSATAKSETVNNQVRTTVTVDNNKVIQQFENNKVKNLLLPVVNTKSDVVVGELNGKLVKAMEGKEASVQIQTDRATYTLPAAQIRIDNISQDMGKDVALEDIKIRVAISESSADHKEQLANAAKSTNIDTLISPVDFEVEATHGDKTVSVHQFNDYVERTIALPDGIDPAKITTGTVLNGDGGLSHVPTNVRKQDNRYYADIKSLTNSTYAVIWNPKTFADVATHWSKIDVNDLASRLIVQGTSADTFSPDRSITRAEFTSILLRALGLHTPQTDQPLVQFSDVSASDWFGQSIGTAVSYKLISGYNDGTFQPDGLITRAEAMTMLERAMPLVHLSLIQDAQAANALLAAFADEADIQPWARQAVASSVKQGIAQGADHNELAPQANLTRAQTAAMIRRMLLKAQLINS
ncbi:S-layer homology domain-containing protein [Paenibacillus oryzisoli]|uniref:S-layer homology domain-containing protein n=1 Tax=Paenibacillus oryzisoli TaxID=1850517 RepID=UPI003D2A550B